MGAVQSMVASLMPWRGEALHGWRRIASAAWAAPNNPQFYGDVEVDASAMLAFIESARARCGVKLTVTHLVGKGMAHAIAAHRELNVRLRGGRRIPRPSVDVFFIVASNNGSELSGGKVVGADTKPVVEIGRELAAISGRIRHGSDSMFGKTKWLMDLLPARLVGKAARTAAWLTMDWNFNLPMLGLPRQAFGSAMVSSMGMFGVPHGYAPLAPIYRVPAIVLVGEVTRRPVADGDAVVIRPMLTVSATIDHRYMDGFHAAVLARSLREYLSDPARFEPPC